MLACSSVRCMDNSGVIFFASALALLTVTKSESASYSYSFWHFDQAAGSTPYYSHFQIGSTGDGIDLVYNPSLATVDLNHGNPSVYTSIENSTSTAVASRSVGWHRFEFRFDQPTSMATIFRDGVAIQSSSYSQTPWFFRFVFHDHIGGPQESVIDDFEFRIDGNLVYQQGFESPTLDSNWIVSRQDPGTYLSSGDTSNPHSGIGSLALGSTTSNNVAPIITFVPEPTSAALAGFSILGLLVRRKR